MAFLSGTATNHYDLLTQLKTWLVGTVGWTQISFTDDAGATTDGVGSILALSAPGVSGNTVYVNIRTVNSSSVPYNCWEMRTAVSNNGATWGNNPGESPAAFLNLWNGSISFWVAANSRRFIIVAKTSTVYTAGYAGFFLPWGNPTQYPFPLFVGGDWGQPATWSVQNTGRRFFTDPGGSPNGPSGAFLRNPSGLWLSGCNEIYSGTANDQGQGPAQGNWFQIWPWATGATSGGSSWVVGASPPPTADGGLATLVPTAQGERWVMPCSLLNGAGAPFGILDGVYNTPGIGLSAETIITIGARNFLASQNIHRNAGNDFLLMEET